MALRNIIKIDEQKCNGCGKCISACAEGAIQLVDGKAKLVSEVYCDGLGACIGHCPQSAITIEQKESEEFDPKAVEQHLTKQKQRSPQIDFVCPGMAVKKLRNSVEPPDTNPSQISSQLSHWPVQLKLVPPTAPYLAGADLLLVADCVHFTMGDFHSRFLTGRSVVVGCPKLDDTVISLRQ
jgi:Fe-S-cluster-containing hydrogenase component 2